MVIARLVAHDSFLAIKSVFRETLEQDLRDQILGQHIDLQLDIVRRRGLDGERLFEMGTKQFAGGAGGFFGYGEMWRHRAEPNRCGGATAKFFGKKNRRKKMNPSPGLN